jgi:hypothetical protein
VLDGDIVRRLEVGQVAYVYRGGVTFLQIKRLTGRQAAIAPGATSIVAAAQADGAGRGAERGAAGAGRGAGVGASGAGAADGDSGWPAGAGGSGEPPTIPLPVVGASHSPAWALASGVPTLPDVSEVLDDAFGARRD